MRTLSDCLPFLAIPLLLAACSEPTRETAPRRIHLTEALNGATSSGAERPSAEAKIWSFPGDEEAWASLDVEALPHLSQLTTTPTEGGLRVDLGMPASPGLPLRVGALRIELDHLPRGAWEAVHVEARSRDRFAGITLAANVERPENHPHFMRFFQSPDLAPPIFNDGSIQTYALPFPPIGHQASKEGPPIEAAESTATSDSVPASETLESLGLFFAAPGSASLEILSISLIPHGAGFPSSVGRTSITREGTTRDTLYAHTPARIEFPLDIPRGARLDTGFAVDGNAPVTYRVLARKGDEPEKVLFETTLEESDAWTQRSIVLTEFEGNETTIVLEALAEPGSIGLWGAPIISPGPGLSASASEPPNVIFYVIDGGDANLMSLYDYGRPTTPFLEELAAEGVLFTRAHSNATWTQPSTVSFMTSLQHSVLGGLRRGVHSTAVPENATTMAEHFRRAGYQTFSLTANPNAGRLIGLQRGVDLLRDGNTTHHSTSSRELHAQFDRMREAYPASPWWVHFQTTDVHEPNEPQGEYAERWVSAEQFDQLGTWDQEVWQAAGDVFGTTSVEGFYDVALERAGIDRQAYFSTRQGLYDETMTHQDAALRDFVTDLKARGEWDNTLLILGSDHGHPAGTFARFGRGQIEPRPEPWQAAMADAYATRVPLLVIWPDRIEGGRRVDTPVSMLDVLPTALELAGLPAPEVAQGQSLVPLLDGATQEAPPVILDEFRIDEASGEMIGNLELIDGRWGASLEIRPTAEGDDLRTGRHEVPAGGRWGSVHRFYPDVPRLLLFDLEADPFATRPVNEEHPELVERYTRELLDLWEAHQALRQRFTSSDAAALSPEQLEQLRSLGYIQ